LFRMFVPIILIYISQGSYAFDNTMELRSDRFPTGFQDLSSISQLIPDLEDLQCLPQCEGGAYCGQFTDVNSCLDQGAQAGCFWSCQ